MTNTEQTTIAVQAAACGFDYAAMSTEHVSGAREYAAWVRRAAVRRHIATIEALAAALLERKMIDGDEIDAMMPFACIRAQPSLVGISG